MKPSLKNPTVYSNRQTQITLTFLCFRCSKRRRLTDAAAYTVEQGSTKRSRVLPPTNVDSRSKLTWALVKVVQPGKLKLLLCFRCFKRRRFTDADAYLQRGSTKLSRVLPPTILDSQSKELLTWALVKVVQPADRVIALHVLKSTGEVRSRDNSSVVDLVNTFDTVLSVYEGFCNLKQFDLKIKLSRGSSVRKTLVQEAKTFGALTVIVGVSKTTTLGSSVSIARYCARQLPRKCSVFAASNGKGMFLREALAVSQNSGAVNESHRPRIFGVIHGTLSKNSKVLSSSSDDTSTNEGGGRNSECETFSDPGDSPEL